MNDFLATPVCLASRAAAAKRNALGADTEVECNIQIDTEETAERQDEAKVNAQKSRPDDLTAEIVRLLRRTGSSKCSRKCMGSWSSTDRAGKSNGGEENGGELHVCE